MKKKNITKLLDKIPQEYYFSAAFNTAHQTYNILKTFSKYGPKRASEEIIHRYKEKSNQPIGADKFVEDHAFLQLVKSRLGRRIVKIYNIDYERWIFGEESIDEIAKDIDFSQIEHPIALLDMLDGSDLFKRRFSNWCIAIAFYVPKTVDIIATFVCDALGRVSYASKYEEGAYLINTSVPRARQKLIRQKLHPLTGRKKRPKIENAIVCFYGQKSREFLAMAQKKQFIKKLDSNKGARIYNLGGNPMLVRVAEGSVDVVLNCGQGQKTHDILPGLFIAIKAGAVVLTLDGKPLTWGSEIIKRALQQPTSDACRVKYIVAATNHLAKCCVQELVK